MPRTDYDDDDFTIEFTTDTPLSTRAPEARRLLNNLARANENTDNGLDTWIMAKRPDGTFQSEITTNDDRTIEVEQVFNERETLIKKSYSALFTMAEVQSYVQLLAITDDIHRSFGLTKIDATFYT